MPAFGTSIPHNLGRERATELLRSFLDQVTAKYGDQLSEMRGDWTDEGLTFGFKTMGMPISGNLVVQDDQVEVKGNLPLAASFFRGRIEESIRGELQKLLGTA